MKSPIRFKKHLVAKAPERLKTADYDTNLYTVKKITQIYIDNDSWLKERKNAFSRMLREGQIGHIVLNNNSGDCVAYGWIAVEGTKPGHIPRVPEGSAWIHYARVKEGFRGQGLHRLTQQERIGNIREKFGDIDIYVDTSEDNIPSRVNQLKLGFLECGIYYTIKIGTKRVPFLYFLFGWWNKDKKHPRIERQKC